MGLAALCDAEGATADEIETRSQQVVQAVELVERYLGEEAARSVRLAHVVVRGDAREALLDAAIEHHADILVVGTRGKNALHRALVGSTADYLMHHAPMSVLVVRPEESLPTSRKPESERHGVIGASREVLFEEFVDG